MWHVQKENSKYLSGPTWLLAKQTITQLQSAGPKEKPQETAMRVLFRQQKWVEKHIKAFNILIQHVHIFKANPVNVLMFMYSSLAYMEWMAGGPQKMGNNLAEQSNMFLGRNELWGKGAFAQIVL